MLLDMVPGTSTSLQVRLEEATVVRSAGHRTEVDTSEGRRWATLAVPSYSPQTGDLVLAVGQGDALYVVGVLRGQGTTTITAQGDLKICAPHGAIEFYAANGVRLKAPTVRIVATHIELLAATLFERVAEATRWCEKVLAIRAGRIRTRVRGEYDLKAGRINERAEGGVHIGGKKIHLG